MEPMAIQTEAAYEAALAEASSLMDAENGSFAGARLDALVTRIEEYEARRWRIAARQV